MHSIEELQELFNAALKKQRFQREPKELYEPFDYVLALGGKRIRPLLMLMACEMFGKDAEEAISQAIAIELFHNFTLIHDDIMDHAPLRRGLETVHEKFGIPVAILSGDAMLVYSYQYLTKTERPLIPQLLDLFNGCAISVCEGQQMDMSFEKLNELTVMDYLKMIELKTAALVATSLKMGAMMGGASEKDADHAYNFGRLLGIAFQLKDDWLDSFGTSEKVGKQPGGDIIRNKKTFLLIEALGLADAATRQELMRWYTDNNVDPEKKVAAVLKIYYYLRVDTLAKKEMEKHFTGAIMYLDAISLPPEKKENLRSLARELLNRDR